MKKLLIVIAMFVAGCSTSPRFDNPRVPFVVTKIVQSERISGQCIYYGADRIGLRVCEVGRTPRFAAKSGLYNIGDTVTLNIKSKN